RTFCRCSTDKRNVAASTPARAHRVIGAAAAAPDRCPATPSGGDSPSPTALGRVHAAVHALRTDAGGALDPDGRLTQRQWPEEGESARLGPAGDQSCKPAWKRTDRVCTPRQPQATS